MQDLRKLSRYLTRYWHRAVLADPRILIFNEAMSSADTLTENHIQETMLRLMTGRTSFVIAHRLSTIRDADQILVINHGEVIQRGTHSALLAQKASTIASTPTSRSDSF